MHIELALPVKEVVETPPIGRSGPIALTAITASIGAETQRGTVSAEGEE